MKSNSSILLITSAILAIIIGLRPPYIGADTNLYLSNFQSFSNYTLVDIRAFEGIFFALTGILYFTKSAEIYLISICFIQLFFLLNIKEKSNKLFFIYLLLMLAIPFFYSITYNVIRQGLAIALLVYILTNNTTFYKRFILYIFALGFHLSALPFIAIIEISKYISFKNSVILSSLSILYCLTNNYDLLSIIPSEILSEADYNYYMSYGNPFQSDYIAGFKIHVLFLSIVGFFISYLYNNKYKNESIPKCFLLFVSFSYFFIDISYNDRFFIYAWILLPYMIAKLIYRSNMLYLILLVLINLILYNIYSVYSTIF
jgi:hypothetical protein